MLDANSQYVVLLVLFFLVVLSVMFLTKNKESYTLPQLVKLATPAPFDVRFTGSVGGFGTPQHNGCGTQRCIDLEESLKEKPCCTAAFFNMPKTLGGMKCNCSPEALKILESTQREGFRFDPTIFNERRPMTRPIVEEGLDDAVLLNLDPQSSGCNTFQNFQMNKFTDCKTCNGSIYSINNRTPLSYYSIDRSRV